MNKIFFKERTQFIHEIIWERFIQKEHFMLYTFLEPKTFTPTLPSPEDIKMEIPNPCGWTTPLEDCAISLGMYIDAMLSAYEVSGEKVFEEKAKKIFSALIKLFKASKKRGFLPRALHPQGVYYPNSSVDQYTLWVYGIWRYWESGLADSEEKEDIKDAMNGILERLHEDAFYIKREDGRDGIYGDLPSFSDPCRATRLLQILLAGAYITEDEKWFSIYEEKKKENGRKRLSTISEGVKEPIAFYPLMQNAYALHLLVNLEEEKSIKTLYAEALKRTAHQALSFLSLYKEYDEKALFDGENMHWEEAYRESKDPWDYVRRWWGKRPALLHISRFVREPLEAGIVILLSETALEELKEVLPHLFSFHFERFFLSHAVVPAECIYHLCCKKGLI